MLLYVDKIHNIYIFSYSIFILWYVDIISIFSHSYSLQIARILNITNIPLLEWDINFFLKCAFGALVFPLTVTASLSFYIMDIPLQWNGKSTIYFFLFCVDPMSKAGFSFRAFWTKATNACLLKVLYIKCQNNKWELYMYNNWDTCTNIAQACVSIHLRKKNIADLYSIYKMYIAAYYKYSFLRLILCYMILEIRVFRQDFREKYIQRNIRVALAFWKLSV